MAKNVTLKKVGSDGILARLRERNPMHHVEGAFNEEELRKNSTRSALNKVNKREHDIAAEMKATRERLAREAGQKRNVD